MFQNEAHVKFGERLSSLREAAGLDLRELRTKADIAMSYMQTLENGEILPSIKTTRKIAWGLDVDSDALVAERNEAERLGLLEKQQAEDPGPYVPE